MSEPMRLAHPLKIALEQGQAVFTHHLGETIFGDVPSLRRYQSIMRTIEEKWPALPKVIDAQLPQNRVAIFTTSNREALEKLTR